MSKLYEITIKRLGWGASTFLVFANNKEEAKEQIPSSMLEGKPPVIFLDITEVKE